MKHIFITILFLGSLSITQAQVSGQIIGGAGGIFGADGSGGRNPMLAQYMAAIGNNNQKSRAGEEILGSPYLTEDFIKSKVYFGEDFMGDFFIRYNALKSEIEIKNSNLPEEEPKRLLANPDLRVKYGSRELKFLTYINKKGETKNGYLSVISEGDTYTLYHRLAVKYSEGKAAVNSMVMPIPSRYAQFVEYYYQKDGVNRIDQLSQKRGALLKILDKEEKEEVSSFLKEEKIDLDEENDLIRTFEFINTLDTSS